MTKTTVAIVVPTKNSAATLEECLQSIQKQSYESTEIVVVDNYSTDDTLEIARRFTPHVFTKGPERCAQRNFGVQKTAAKYVAIIDSDMQLSEKVISECVALLAKDSSIKGAVIPEESFGIGFWAQCKRLERSFYLGVPYMEAARFFAKSTFNDAGGYDENMTSGEDWDLSQRIEKIGTIGRVNSFIYHNEGKISLLRTIRKKYYYAQKFAAYTAKSSSKNVSNQTSIVGRYKLFFSRPGHLFRNPILGVGMLFMKTCEFAFGGAGYILAKKQR